MLRDLQLYVKVLPSSRNISRHHSTHPLNTYVGRPFHVFIPFNLFSVTKQNLLIFSKAPSESLYAHSVPFSYSLTFSDTHTDTQTTGI